MIGTIPALTPLTALLVPVIMAIAIGSVVVVKKIYERTVEQPKDKERRNGQQ